MVGTTHTTYACAKCGHAKCETDEFHATGGSFAKFFDVQNKRFATVSCKQCGHTEFYRGDTSTLSNIFDFIGGG